MASLQRFPREAHLSQRSTHIQYIVEDSSCCHVSVESGQQPHRQYMVAKTRHVDSISGSIVSFPKRCMLFRVTIIAKLTFPAGPKQKTNHILFSIETRKPLHQEPLLQLTPNSFSPRTSSMRSTRMVKKRRSGHAYTHWEEFRSYAQAEIDVACHLSTTTLTSRSP